MPLPVRPRCRMVRRSDARPLRESILHENNYNFEVSFRMHHTVRVVPYMTEHFRNVHPLQDNWANYSMEATLIQE